MGMHVGGGLGPMSGNGSGGGHNRSKMHELAKNEHLDWAIVRRALFALTPYRLQAVFVSLLLLAIAAGSVLPAWLTEQMIDVGIAHANVHLLILYTLMLILTTVVTGLLGVWQTWLSNVIAQDVMADYRLLLFNHIQRQSISFFSTRQSGDLVSRVMNDVTAIQNVITTTLVGLVSNVLVITATLLLMFSMNWQMAVLSLVVVPAFVFPTQRVGRLRQNIQGNIQHKLSQLTIQLTEQFGVSGALLTRIFTREQAEATRFHQTSQELRDLQVRRILVGRWLFMWLGMFSAIGPALLFGYGGWLVIHHLIALGTVVAFTTLLGRLYNPLSQLAQLHVSILSSIALYRRIFGLLDIEPEIHDGSNQLNPAFISGKIELHGVSHRYSTQTETGLLVLKNIDFTVDPGQMVALVGPSGAGKTTILNLISRFYDPLCGEVMIDGIDIRELTLASLRAHMGLVPQDPFFFHDTIHENLLIAKPNATRAEMVTACMAAQIHETIDNLPEGYDTVVGERGYRLSGGERQRLAIARVLLREPKIVLLDEATSALDTLVERKIQTALLELLRGRTSIVIAHRLSTVLSANYIIVIDEGTMVAQGTHAALLENSLLYRSLYEAQFANT